jgi:hypothetical protein
VGEGNQAADLVAIHGAALHSRKAVVRIVEEVAVLRLQAIRAIEVASYAGDNAGRKGIVVLAIDVAVDRTEVAVASVDFDE